MFPGFVFLRPFKLFVKYQHTIRQSLIELQLHVDQSKDVSSPVDGTNKSPWDSGNGDYKFDDEDLLADLKLLVDILDNDLQPTFHLSKSINNGTAATIEFADLWHLFDYGTIVVLQSDEARAYRVVNFTGGREPLTPMMSKEEDRVPALDGFIVDCIGLTFDGSDFVPTLHKFKIHRFPGSRPISSLPVYPLVFHQNSQRFSDGLRSRGQRFMDITTPPFSHHFMTGRTLDETSHDVEAPVIVDMAAAFNSVVQWRPKMAVDSNDLTKPDTRETYLVYKCKHSWQDGEGCCGHDTVFKDHLMDEKRAALFTQNNGQLLGPRKKEELTEDDLLLLPDRVHGFVLRNRQWVTMKVTDLSEVKYLNNFEKLMLPEKHKTSILALVNTHERVQQNSGTSVGAALDLVRGKGTGLIMLLHGEPGVGKTSTAECVADSTRRPLYPITCGDVGETAMEVEKNLSYNFTLAHKWGCVLLLDEADVFLAKRSKTDLRRNAVTSVFLRSLEYYAGILFLTTNRVGGIDPAFKSRIHLSLFYPRLRKDETIKLYKVFIQRAKDEQARLGSNTFKIDKKQIVDFAKKHYREMDREGLGTWNGRQIRNAFQAAIALVEHDSQQARPGAPKPTLGDKQFEIVAESSKEFDKYLYTTLGGGESDIAKREEWRADRFQNQFRSGSKPGRSYASKSGSTRAELEPDTDETSSESEEPDSDDHSDDGDVMSQANQKKDEQPAGVDATDASAADFEAFKQFLKFKEGRR
ncbi:hypothetical protein KJ359_007200 [Pestalotiopsis sp. 9143b]|nr:hypothetical protein KJ359_007200 [Pestalotiopsis sp. 9143b]